MAKKKQLDFNTYKEKFKGIEKVKEICDKHQALIHASNILKKAEDCANEPDSSSKITKLNFLVTMRKSIKTLRNA